MNETIHFELNGQPAEFTLDEDRVLLWVLRTKFRLTGTKFGCGIGFCGACTVIINGEAVRSCMTAASEISGKQVLTIEGLTKQGQLHPLQNAFVKYDAVQCGYCTPGMIMNAYGLLLKNPEPSRQEIIDGMEDNLCRCGTYGRVIKAIQSAAKEMKGGTRP